MAVARVNTTNVAEIVLWVAGAVAVVAIDAALLGVSLLVLPVGLALALFGVRNARVVVVDDSDAWNRPAALPGDASIASPAITLAHALSPRLALTVVGFTAVAVGVDLVTGRDGFGAAMLAGTLLMQLGSQAVAARRTAAWQREHRTVLYTDAEGRYYSRPA